MKLFTTITGLLFWAAAGNAQSGFVEKASANSFLLNTKLIYVDSNDLPGVVLQKLVLDFGGLKPGYLGPPETMAKK